MKLKYVVTHEQKNLIDISSEGEKEIVTVVLRPVAEEATEKYFHSVGGEISLSQLSSEAGKQFELGKTVFVTFSKE